MDHILCDCYWGIILSECELFWVGGALFWVGGGWVGVNGALLWVGGGGWGIIFCGKKFW